MANEMRDKLVEILLQKTCHYSDVPCDKECSICGNLEIYRSDIEKLADHLIENGVIVPPMRLGQMCYEPYHSNWSSEVRPHRVSSVTQKADGSFKIRLTNLITKSVGEITPDKIGKTVFLTKDQAEQKLKEMRGE